MTTNMLSPFAQATLDRAWDMKLPVDPFILVRSLNWSLYFSEDLNEGDSPFEVDEENTCVYLHPRLLRDVYMLRFQCACALGHIVSSTYGIDADDEDIANFATEVLIPEKFLGFIHDVQFVQEAFVVDSATVLRRQSTLRLSGASTTGSQQVEMTK